MKKKLPKRLWLVIKGYLDNWQGEIHHLCKGQQYESLSTMIPLAVEDHRGKHPAKNYLTFEHIPEHEKEKCLFFWRGILSEDDYQLFRLSDFEK